jgi:hypothetical protein
VFRDETERTPQGATRGVPNAHGPTLLLRAKRPALDVRACTSHAVPSIEPAGISGTGPEKPWVDHRNWRHFGVLKQDGRLGTQGGHLLRWGRCLDDKVRK